MTDFIWTAKLYENAKPVQTLYFAIEEDRNMYVNSHEGWKKRGKICAQNLPKHLSESDCSFYER